MMKKGFLLLVASAVVGLVLSTSTPAKAITVDYTTVANGTYSAISLGGTTVTGSGPIVSDYYAGFRGLGVSSLSLDDQETMTIDFGRMVSNVLLTLVDIDPPGNVTFAFEAFNGASSLGKFDFPYAQTHPETFDLMALSGLQELSKFVLSVRQPTAPLGLQIQGVSYDTNPVPEPSTILLLGVGLAGLAGLRKKRS
jgi:hypothetical protein